MARRRNGGGRELRGPFIGDGVESVSPGDVLVMHGHGQGWMTPSG